MSTTAILIWSLVGGFAYAACRELLSRAVRARIRALQLAVNNQVAKRRAAVTLLREAAELFRTYETHHRAKIGEVGRPEKAERNAEIAGRIETFIKGIHQ